MPPVKERSLIHRQFRVFRRIVLTIFLLMVAMLMIMIFGIMEDQVDGKGTVAGIREYYIKSLVNARTTKILHWEGQEVVRNTPLLEFDARNQHDRIALINNEIKELELSINVKEKALEILRKDPLPDYYRHTKIALDEAEIKFQRSKYELEVYNKLYQQQAISRREILKIEMEHLANEATLKRLQEDWKKLQDGMAKQILEQAEDELKLLNQRLVNKKKELELEAKHLEDYIIHAPETGIITEIPPRPGGYYEKGEIIVKVAANRNKKVIAMIDEKQIFKVEKGQRVRIASRQYNYFDYGYFDGEVDEVFQLPENIGGTNYYPVKIILLNEPQPLRFGSSCDVTIITGHERIIFVLLGLRSKEYLKRRGLSK